MKEFLDVPSGPSRSQSPGCAKGQNPQLWPPTVHGNLFEDLKPPLPQEPEFSEALIPDQGILIERIVSTGQITPEGTWYDQPRDEWVVLLSGKAVILWDDGQETALGRGDWILIPAHRRHRVQYTSAEPPCLWLAFHGDLGASRP